MVKGGVEDGCQDESEVERERWMKAGKDESEKPQWKTSTPPCCEYHSKTGYSTLKGQFSHF